MADGILAHTPTISEPEQKIFKSSLFGFKRDDVLTYVSELNKRSSDLAVELNASITKLEDCLASARDDNQELVSKSKELENQVSLELARGNDFESQVQAMRLVVDKANDEAAAHKSRLFASLQENTMLKADNSRLNSSINVLNATIAEYESQKDEYARVAQQAIFDAEAIKQKATNDAKLTRDKASNDAVILIAAAEKEKNAAKETINASAYNIALSVNTIKSELDAVDAKIASAINELSHITSGISNALSITENDLSALGVQLEDFPQPIKPVMPIPTLVQQPRRHKKPDTASESILSRLAKLLR